MAIENVVMMNVVGKSEYVDRFAKDIFLYNDIQVVNAMNEIDTGRFTLTVSEKNLDELIGFSKLTPGDSIIDEKVFVNRMEKLGNLYDNQLSIDMNYLHSRDIDLDAVLKKADEYEHYLNTEYGNIQTAQAELEQIETSINAYRYLEELDVEMADLNQMEYFNYTVGSVSKDNAARLKSVYNTVTSLVFHVGDNDNEEVFLIISPKDFEVETGRILKALNFLPITGFDPAYVDKPKEVLAKLNNRQHELTQTIQDNRRVLEQHQDKNRTEAGEIYSVLSLYANLNRIKKDMAFSDTNFYFSGWVPQKDMAAMEKNAEKYEGLIVQFHEPDDEYRPPTKLRNNWLFKPFEQLVKMYGVPAYNELDPTPFLSITYLFCFGYMFGDVGQGLVLLLAGVLLGKKGVGLGRVIARMGCASILFGFVYGSVFGNEAILKGFWVKPFHAINTVLLTAVVIGVIMLLAAYGYSIINKLRMHNIKDGVFGKDGIAGLVLYLTILTCALTVLGYAPIPKALVPAMAVLIVVLIFLVLVREPLTNMLQRRQKLYETTAGDYYVEAGFELFEMLLAMLSNTLSFIRVGAFALTHVGLFMAFETLSTMVGGGVGGIIVLVIGNIFVIVLEGLIDFIQCLRLQFYELFSKYYIGDGEEFQSIGAETTNTIL